MIRILWKPAATHLTVRATSCVGAPRSSPLSPSADPYRGSRRLPAACRDGCWSRSPFTSRSNVAYSLRLLAAAAVDSRLRCSGSPTTIRWGGGEVMKKKSWTVSHVGFAQAVCVACLGLAAELEVAQQPSTQSQQPVEEVTVTGTRLITSGVNTPTPVTSVSAVDLQKMAPSTLIESLSQLPVFDNNLASQQAVGGSVAAGGSNLNLRGLEAPRTLVLLDGHRLGPSNKFGTVDVGVIPETLVRSVEAVTGGASAAYGADAVAGVVNFRLDRKLSGFKTSFQAGATTYGDDDTY